MPGSSRDIGRAGECCPLGPISSPPSKEGDRKARGRLVRAARDLIVPSCRGRPTKDACRERARVLKSEGIVQTITSGLELLTGVVDEIRSIVLARLERDRAPVRKGIHWKVNHNPVAIHAEIAERREKREEARRNKIRSERAARKALPKTEWQQIWEHVTGPKDRVLVHDPHGARLRVLKISSEREVVGWNRNRYGSKPILGGYFISRHDAIRFYIDKKKREQVEQRRNERAERTDPDLARKRKEEVHAAHALRLTVAEYRRLTDEERAARKRCCEWEDRRQQHGTFRDALLFHANGDFRLLVIRPQIRVLKRYPALARKAARGLRDLREADPEWLDEALEAADQNIWRKGRAYEWYRSGEIDFYQFLRIALKVHRRHTGTNYDELLAEGFDRDTARSNMMEEH